MGVPKFTPCYVANTFVLILKRNAEWLKDYGHWNQMIWVQVQVEPAVYPWTNYFTPLSLIFLIWKKEEWSLDD